jgi:flagellar assembly protein FliH
VLHREAQMDPLLLRGAVRVALEDAQRGTCVLEVPADRAEAWGRWLSEMGAQARVQIRAKDDVAPGHCRVEIGPSAADLSVNTQLAEIERGFFDLLQNRPSPVESEPKQER